MNSMLSVTRVILGSSLVLCCVGAVLVLCLYPYSFMGTSMCQAVCSGLQMLEYSLVVSLVSPRRPAASQRGQVQPTSFASHASSLLPTSAALRASQHFSVSLSNSVHLCSFPPRLAARSGLCSISVVSLCISVPLCTHIGVSCISFPCSRRPCGLPRLLLRFLWGPIPYLGVYKVFDFKG